MRTQVSFRDVPVSDAVVAAVEKHAAKLARYYDRVVACRVVVALPHHHHHRQGAMYSVRVDVTVPGEEIVVNREHAADHAYEDVYMAMRRTFDAVRRRLEDHVRKVRGQVKTHMRPSSPAGIGGH